MATRRLTEQRAKSPGAARSFEGDEEAEHAPRSILAALMPLRGLLALPGCEDDAPKRALARDARPAKAGEGPRKGWVLLRPKKQARVPSPEKLRERVAGWRADTSAAETAPAAAVLPSAPKARKERAPKVAGACSPS